MAQNLFEKYGIKEVADVTLYRIERKDETYESQRKISISSILKGALTKQFVYPLDEDGKGENDGYEAYVFKDADVLTHYNYDCDDVINVKGVATYLDINQWTKELSLKVGDQIPEDATIEIDGTDKNIIDLITADFIADDDDDKTPNMYDSEHITVKSAIDTAVNRDVRGKVVYLLANGYEIDDTTFSIEKSSVVLNGTTNDKVTYGEEDLVQWVAQLEGPMTFKGDAVTRIRTLAKEFAKNGGYLSTTPDVMDENEEISDSTTIVINGGSLVIGAPYDATGDEIRAYYNLQYKEALDSTGILCRFTQPIRSLTPYDSKYYNAVIEVKLAYTENVTVTDDADTSDNDDSDETPSTGSATKTYTFNNALLTTEEIAAINAFVEDPSVDGYSALTSLEGRTGVTVSTTDISPIDFDLDNATLSGITEATVIEEPIYNVFTVSYSMTISSTDEALTGIHDLEKDPEFGHFHMDKDAPGAGTHEFSYPEQICMLFAKNQNLITKSGGRYRFADPDGMFGEFDFDDNFASAPSSTERVVVVGLAGRTSENLYDFDEINEAIKNMTDTVSAKAYDVTYIDYAELVVNSEMGYYMPQQLGKSLDKKAGEVEFFKAGNTYDDFAKTGKGIDVGIHKAIKTWSNDTHYSINDAIDALKQEAKVIDGQDETRTAGFNRVFGGYKVQGDTLGTTALPVDDIGRGGEYEDFMINGNHITDAITGEQLNSSYALDDVLEKLATADYGSYLGQLRISATNEIESNRAIYIDPENGVLGNGAFIYLLKNVSGKTLTTDKNGIFEFRDKKGNRLYYQDKIYAGTAYLALVVIGTFGLIFVVDRHCTKNFTQTAWMINDNGYITDKQAERIVKNGLIHTVTVTSCDESFDATCTVGSIKVRKTKKNVLRYVPVLFLDTLKVSTLEQASESTDATGGRGNAKLITWDYGKEITLSIEDALYTPASMAAIWAGEHGDLKNGVKDTTMIDRMEKITAKRSFIVPAGNSEGTPTEGNTTAQAVYYDPKTMEPFQDGTPIAEGEVVYKYTRSVAYDGNSIGNTIEISAEKFPGTYKVVGETFVRDKATGEDQRFQFIIPEAKMSAEDTSITLEADGDPVVFSFTMNVLRPDNGVMMKFVQFDVEENEEENDGSTMVKDTENLNLLDDAEMYKVSGGEEEELVIGATEY